jgi:hypothetical protein
MKAKHITQQKIATGKTKDGHDYFINEYPATKHSQWERVGYVQLPRESALSSSHPATASYQVTGGTRESSENPGLRRAEVGSGKGQGTLIVTDNW